MDEKKDISWQLSFLIGAVLGAVVYLVLFGFKTIDISNDGYLMNYQYDTTTHYLGWRLYRASAWHFPIGLCDTGMYPGNSSIVFTDSIPLFAVFFKLLSPILPQKFQYFGIFGLMCFMLQGGMSKILLRKKIHNELIRNVGAMFFILNIVFVHRMFWQTALAAHFLILTAFIFYVYREDIKSYRKKILLWVLLGVVSISIHFYLYGMVSVMMGFFALLETIEVFLGSV